MPKRKKSFSNLGKLIHSGKVTRGATGQEEPYIRPDENDEKRLRYKELRGRKDPLYGYEDSKKMVKEANEASNFPIDFFACGILLTISTAIGNCAKLKVKTGWEEAPILYICNIGDSGVMKTWPLKFATQPLYDIDGVLSKRYNESKKEFILNVDNFRD